jgi:uncharacterized protein (TIGR02466 family)
MDRQFTQEEIDFFEKQRDDVRRNVHNVFTNDDYILLNKEMKGIHDDLMIAVKQYMEKVYCNTSVTPYITQSWINYTTKNQAHHKHTHSNSFISGVLYLSADKDQDKIVFDRNAYHQIRVTPDSFNQYNGDTHHVHVRTGQVVLFPSYLTHYVEAKGDDSLRVSLAFNVFLKGFIGDSNSLNELQL